MVTQANIIDAKEISKRRISMRPVQSLARIETPPDTVPLTAALQTTLELDEMLALFKRELEQHVQIDGLLYRNSETGLLYQHGVNARNRASYGLTLIEEPLGDITLSRNAPFSEHELALVEYLLCPLLYPLRNALRYKIAISAAYRDPLTGVHNRAALEEMLSSEIELASRHKLPLTMALIDLDHFKRINDTYGHAAGDCTLRNTARQISNLLRASDRVFRYGGEEFILLLAAIAAKPYPCEGQAIPVTVSIGYAEIGAEDNQHTLFDKADKALYQAKKQGRNQVQAFD